MTEPEKMKVAELRAALQEKGLDTKGTKPVLVARLQEALDAENKEPSPEPEAEKVEEVTAMDESAAEVKTEEKTEAATEEVKEDVKMETEATETPKTEVKEEAKTDEKKDQGVKRKMDEEPFEVKENEPEIPGDLMCLDWHNSDLNLRILDTLSEGVPFSRDGWAYCYAAARATYGFKGGKLWYEVKYVDNMDVKIEKETTTHDLRVGWSTNSASLMLGEDNKSWCYSACEGKMAHDKKFEDYGEKFTKGDVVGAFIDFSQNEINVTFTKNGEDQGDAFQISKEELGEDALFPHIATRNVKFEVNFGIDKAAADKENWKEPLAEEYVKVGKMEDRVRGNERVSSRDQCEVIMMIGLPGCGKSTWVAKHVEENPEKQYNVVSTGTMINKMTVNGEPRKEHHKGKWEQVVQKATRSLQEMLRAASQRRRNVIIDQTNVYPSAQKRKARPFEGFQRRAVVVVPNDETYKERVAAQAAAGNKDIPDEAIMEMKANFALPEDESDAVVPMFKDVVFTELNREEAVKVVDLYNKVAKEKGYGKKHEERKVKKFKGGQNQRGGAKGGNNQKPNQNNQNRNNRPMRGGMQRGRGGGPPMRGGPWMRGRGGPMGPGPMARGGRGGMMSRGPGPMGPSPWSQGGNTGPMGMGGPMGGGPQGWGPWNQNQSMGPRGGMGGGNFNNFGNQGNQNFRGNMNGMNTMGGGMGGGNMNPYQAQPQNFSSNNFGGGMGMNGGGMGMGGNNFNSGMGMGGGNNYNQGGNMMGGNNTSTWSSNTNMGGQQRQGGNFQGNKFGNQNQGGFRQQNQNKFSGGMQRGGMQRGGGGGGRGMGFAGGRGGQRGGNRGRKF